MQRAAIIDMYDGTPNLGLASIVHLLEKDFPGITYDIFEIRGRHEVPDLDYDVYISTGGPGHPLEGNEAWEDRYFKLVDDIIEVNQLEKDKKFMLFICHSFQIACAHFGIGTINKRPEESFGIFRVKKTASGDKDPIFRYLPDPFYAADFRTYQVVDPDLQDVEEKGFEILAMEDDRNHDFEHQALMAVKFTDQIYGVQFHPEAYPSGMTTYFKQENRKQTVLDQYGIRAYNEMMFHLRDPIKIDLTHKKVVPGFLKYAQGVLNCKVI